MLLGNDTETETFILTLLDSWWERCDAAIRAYGGAARLLQLPAWLAPHLNYLLNPAAHIIRISLCFHIL